MRWWGWALVWGAAAVPFGVLVGRSIRHADRPRYTPQTDVPLWRGTDLDDPDDDGLPSWDPEPPDRVQRHAAALLPPGLFAAITALGAATDETTARYWLAVCARRGATWEQQRDLWDEWTRLHDTSVTYLDTHRPEDPRP